MQELPPIIAELLQNNNLLHLGTCKDDVPSVSLMNFSYVAPTETSPATIILASPKDTRKMQNMRANPNVSVLIHDWTSVQTKKEREQQPAGIAQFLAKLNQAQLSQTSVTLDGRARIPAGEEAEYYRAKLLENNAEAECFIKGADIVLVEPHHATVADFQNHVQEFAL